ncbi:MAG: TonB-dependent receptor [Proteobacteria bacterium]|nr:TonB-dependent receptor [Pseudomonadota bacterium]
MLKKSKINRLLSPAIALALLAPAGYAPVALAQQDAPEIEQIVVTGSRGRPRTVSDSPVPIDVFSTADIEAVSYTDTNDILRTLVPSFSVRQSNSDGEEFIRPAQLRGMPSDKTLVLVNSKRRHRSPLVALVGSGAQAVDMSTIPAAAIGTIEVLRDGAAAQYGSDAIAGVINFILKDNREGGSLSVDFGEFSEGDGESTTISGNIGLPLTDNGFISISAQYEDRDGTNRAEQVCRTAFCPDSTHRNYDTFIANGDTDRITIAQDPAFQALWFANAANPGWDTNQRWGRPNHEAFRVFFNAGIDLDGGSELYAFGNYSDGESDKTFFNRFPYNGTLEDIRESDGGIYNPLEMWPGGFTPNLFGDVKDMSLVAGLRGEWGNGVSYDFSARMGESEVDYTLNRTINPSMGRASPTRFSLGDLTNEETQLQADFTYELESGALFAFGASWMDESYDLGAGDPDSSRVGPYAVQDPFGFCNDDGSATAAGTAVIGNGSSLDCANSSDAVYRTVGVGSNGFPGRNPMFADTYDRTSYAAYGDLSGNVSDNLFLQGALRYEDYDDFGSELVWKVAGKLDVTDTFGIRASLGTSFRAPTPGQQGTTNVSTRLPFGEPIETGTFPAGGPVGAALGFDPLKPELADNYTIGFTAELGDTDLTVDFFRIDIQDRTYLQSFRPVSTDPTAGEGYDNFLALQSAGVSFAAQLGGVRSFQSAFDTINKGVDIVVTRPIDWGDAGVTTVSAAFNYTEVKFDSPLSQYSGFINAEDRFDFENIEPNMRGVFTARHQFDRLLLIGRLSYYGESEDSRSGTAVQTFDAVWYTDLEGQYRFSDNISLSLGARNLFDEYPDKVDPALGDYCCGRVYSDLNGLDWQGAYYYGRLSLNF